MIGYEWADWLERRCEEDEVKKVAVEMGGDGTPSPDGDPIAFPISAGMKFKQIQWIPCLNYTRGRRLLKNLIACSFAVITKEWVQ